MPLIRRPQPERQSHTAHPSVRPLSAIGDKGWFSTQDSFRKPLDEEDRGGEFARLYDEDHQRYYHFRTYLSHREAFQIRERTLISAMLGR